MWDIGWGGTAAKGSRLRGRHALQPMGALAAGTRAANFFDSQIQQAGWLQLCSSRWLVLGGWPFSLRIKPALLHLVAYPTFDKLETVQHCPTAKEVMLTFLLP